MLNRNLISCLLCVVAGIPARAADDLEQAVVRLKSPDRQKRLDAAAVIRDGFKNKSLDTLPDLVAGVGAELDRAPDPSHPRDGYLRQYTLDALWQAADESGPQRLPVVRGLATHADPRVRAAALRVWWRAAYDPAAGVTPADLLAAVRRALKDSNALVRGQAVLALCAFRDTPPHGLAQAGFRDASPAMMREVVGLLVAALDDRTKPRAGLETPAYHASVALQRLKADARPALAALAQAAASDHPDDDHWGMACEAIRSVTRNDPTAAAEAVTAVRVLYLNERRDAARRARALNALVGVGVEGRRVLPDAIEFIDRPAVPPLRAAAYMIVIDQGPRATGAVPSLLRRLDAVTAERSLLRIPLAILRVRAGQGFWAGGWAYRRLAQADQQSAGRQEQFVILSALAAMGPAASNAVGPLERWMVGVDDQVLLDHAGRTWAAVRP